MVTEETTKSDSKLQAFGSKLADVLPTLLGGGGTDADKKKTKEELIKKLPELIPLWYDSVLKPTADDIALMSMMVFAACGIGTQMNEDDKPGSKRRYDSMTLSQINDGMQRYLKFKASQLTSDDTGKTAVIELIEANMTTAAPKAV